MSDWDSETPTKRSGFNAVRPFYDRIVLRGQYRRPVTCPTTTDAAIAPDVRGGLNEAVGGKRALMGASTLPAEARAQTTGAAVNQQQRRHNDRM